MSLEPADAVEAAKTIGLNTEEIGDLAAVLKLGKPTVDRICPIVAAVTEREGNPLTDKPLSTFMVRSTYYRLRDDV